MSIINQALKKAQRERLLHDTQAISHLRHLPASRSPRRWLLIATGFVVALGVGAILHAWLTAPAWQPTVAARPQPVTETATSVTPPGPAVPAVTTQPAADLTARDAAPDVSPPPPDLTARDVVSDVSPPRTSSPRTEVRAAAVPPYGSTPVAPSPPPARRLQQAAVSPLPTLPQDPAVAAPEPAAPPQDPAVAAPEPAAPPPQTQSQARTLFNQAIESQAAGQRARALALLQQAITLDPELQAAYNSLGNLYYRQQQYDQAIVMYQKALAIDPDYAKARNNLGSTYLRLAMDEQAREELQKALQADSSYALAYYNLACVYARAGNGATAAQYLQQAMTLEPQARAWAQTDDDFARVRTAPEIRQLVEP